MQRRTPDLPRSARAALVALAAASAVAGAAVAAPAAVVREAPTQTAAVAPQESPAADPAAIATIEKLHEQLLGVMKDAEKIGYRGRYERLHEVVGRFFDLPFMAEKSVGRHWKKLTPEEQQRWLASFHDMTAATYADRFEGFSGQHFEIVGAEPARHDTLLVRARLVDPGGEDVQLNYRLQRTGDQWRVVDVYLNGTVSELALRRSEYSTVLKRDGFDKLIETVEGKTQELAAGSLN